MNHDVKVEKKITYDGLPWYNQSWVVVVASFVIVAAGGVVTNNTVQTQMQVKMDQTERAESILFQKVNEITPIVYKNDEATATLKSELTEIKSSIDEVKNILIKASR